MSDTLTIPERREAYRQRMAESAKQNEAKIKAFMEVVLANVRRHHPDVKMEWRERDRPEDLLPTLQPELVLKVRLKGDDWCYAIRELDVLMAHNYDEFLTRNVFLLIAMIERKLERSS